MTVIISFWQFFHERSNQSSEEAIRAGNREAILQKVESFWVLGLLQNIREGIGLLDNRYTNADHLTDSPLRTLTDNVGLSQTTQTSNLLEIFRNKGGELLILGQPGSGKSTTLLVLTEWLVKQCRENDNG